MGITLEQSDGRVHRSGTGIHRSGTGIHRSGTGRTSTDPEVKKGGTGLRIPSLFAAVAVITAVLCSHAFATDPDVLVSDRGDRVMVSMHTDTGIFTGSVPRSSGEAGYYRVGLTYTNEARKAGNAAQPLIKSSGSGNSGEGIDPNGGSLLIKSSGSGDAGEGGCADQGLLIKSSGSGNAGESIDNPGGSLMIKSSGSGNSGDAVTPCGGEEPLELVAEVVIDDAGSHIVVLDPSGHEVLVAFVETNALSAPDRRPSNASMGFVATP